MIDSTGKSGWVSGRWSFKAKQQNDKAIVNFRENKTLAKKVIRVTVKYLILWWINLMLYILSTLIKVLKKIGRLEQKEEKMVWKKTP